MAPVSSPHFAPDPVLLPQFAMAGSQAKGPTDQTCSGWAAGTDIVLSKKRKLEPSASNNEDSEMRIEGGKLSTPTDGTPHESRKAATFNDVCGVIFGDKPANDELLMRFCYQAGRQAVRRLLTTAPLQYRIFADAVSLYKATILHNVQASFPLGTRRCVVETTTLFVIFHLTADRRPTECNAFIVKCPVCEEPFNFWCYCAVRYAYDRPVKCAMQICSESLILALDSDTSSFSHSDSD